MPQGPSLTSTLTITSPQNPRIKLLSRLMSDSRHRRQSRSFVLEGAREINRALLSGFRPIACYKCPHLHGPEAQDVLITLESLDGSRYSESCDDPFFYDIPAHLFEKIALRGEKDGLLVVFHGQTPMGLADLTIWAEKKNEASFFLALQGVEKPGNLGAMIRSADAFGVDGILIVSETPPDSVDLFHPHLIRNSLGAVFSKSFAVLSPDELVGFCSDHHIRLVGAALNPQSLNLYQAKLTGPIVLLMGSESFGIDGELQKRCHTLLEIPMHGLCDSLNVSTATAVILSEIVRQRLTLKNSSYEG
jgi:TrmH family RNA methyltransferase